MILRRAPMSYDRELSRWVVEGRDAWYSMRCGEGIQLHIEEQTVSGKIELGRTSWCIYVGEVSLGLLEHRDYVVTIEV